MSATTASTAATSTTCDSAQIAPPTYNRSMVYLHFSDGSKAIDWYKSVFGVSERQRVESVDKKHILHAELQLGDSVILLNDMPTPAGMEPGPANSSLYTYVADVDATYAIALKHGALSKVAPNDAFYGDRMACFKDPFGNQWVVAKKLTTRSDEEVKSAIEARAKAAAAESEDAENKRAGACCGVDSAKVNVCGQESVKTVSDSLLRHPKMSHIHSTKIADRKPKQIVSAADWLTRMQQHVSEEKALTHHKDYVTSLRQQLPWTEVRSDYVFEDLSGRKLSFAEIFTNPNHDGLLMYVMMLPAGVDKNDACPMCAFWVDNLNGNQYVLNQKTNIAIVCKGSPSLISELAKKRGWNANLPLYSAQNSRFLEDLGLSLTRAEYDEFKKLFDECKGDGEAALNKMRQINPNHPNVRESLGAGLPFPMLNIGGTLVFHLDRQANKIYKTFETAGRGAESINAGLHALDLLPYGRESFFPTL